jgi:hypothetical protein
MNDFKGIDPPVSACANCGRQIQQIRSGDALIWERIQRPVLVCTNDRGEPLGPERYATPTVNWSAEDFEFLAQMRIKP